MKEQMTYVAIDADDVGQSIGNAVLENDTSKLTDLSGKINAGVQIFAQWAEHNGGNVISSGSDEAVVQVPLSSLEELESIKEEYAKKTGFTVSIGTGEKVSDAAKALIYAKMNGKNQIIEYSGQLDDSIRQNISGEESYEDSSDDQIPEHEEHLSPEEKELHDSTEEMSDKEEVVQEEMAEVGEDVVTDEELPDQSLPQETEESIGEADADEALGELVESKNPADEDIDLDGRPDKEEEHGAIEPEVDDIDSDGDVEHEEAMAVESGNEAEYTDEEEDDFVEEGSLSESLEEEMEEEAPMEEAPMEEAPMEEAPMEEAPMEEAPMEEFTDQEMVGDDEAPVDEDDEQSDLKTVIYDSLQTFKQNRDFLESMAHENPELYNGLIYCLQAMIEMAKELGYGNMAEEEVADIPTEEEDVSGEGIEHMETPEMEYEDKDELPEENDETKNDDDEDGEIEKTEAFMNIMKRMDDFWEKISLLKEEESVEEIKEKVKKKIEEKSSKIKKPGKKRKPSVKKPIAPGKNKKKQKKESNEGSFCAKSHKKMRSSGKDCRANEDKDSPLCTARKKFNCRGKNEEKNRKMDKSEKLSIFLKKTKK